MMPPSQSARSSLRCLAPSEQTIFATRLIPRTTEDLEEKRKEVTFEDG
jgi:hypothetical protein